MKHFYTRIYIHNLHTLTHTGQQTTENKNKKHKQISLYSPHVVSLQPIKTVSYNPFSIINKTIAPPAYH